MDMIYCYGCEETHRANLHYDRRARWICLYTEEGDDYTSLTVDEWLDAKKAAILPTTWHLRRPIDPIDAV